MVRTVIGHAALIGVLVLQSLAAPELSPPAQVSQTTVGSTGGQAQPLTSAPDFSRMDVSGHEIRLSHYRGRVVLLSFWATWCEPCRAEVPRFSAWQQQYGTSGLQVLGISMDDDVQPVLEFVQRLQVRYPIAMGDAKLGELFGGVLGLPLAYLIDPAGRIVARYRGELDLNGVENEIRVLLPAANR